MDIDASIDSATGAADGAGPADIAAGADGGAQAGADVAAVGDAALSEVAVDAAGDGGGTAGGDGDGVGAADAAAEVVAACPIPTAAGHHQPKCQGLILDLHIPASCAKGGCGLVVDVHGATMDAAMQDYNTDLRALGEQMGYVVVQPNALPPPPASAWIAADDAVVLAFTKSAIAALAIDPKRVHFTGFSQGGWMGWRMVCQYPQLFASVAIGAACSSYGGQGCSFQGEQVPAVQTPLLYMHGTLDVLQPWFCAEQQTAGLTKAWQLQQTKVLAQDSKHQWRRLASPSGTIVELIQHDYSALAPTLGGHCYPGSPDQIPKFLGQIAGFGCAGQSAFHWGKAALGFFAAHPKP